jgi:hypothetical protein
MKRQMIRWGRQIVKPGARLRRESLRTLASKRLTLMRVW